VNWPGIIITAVVLLVTVGFLAASGVFVPYTAGPGYQPMVTATSTPESGVTTTGGGPMSMTPTPSRYEHAVVTAIDRNGTELGEVRAAVADTPEKRYIGLSDTEVLPDDRGMLFTYVSESNHTYVMREMDFGIDIVYIGHDGVVTTIHHAPKPPLGEDGNEFRYPGRGQYVLEVNLHWTTRHGIEEGDRIEIHGRG
jgi:uncharacterized membrane protein (UPF0127 family)